MRFEQLLKTLNRRMPAPIIVSRPPEKVTQEEVVIVIPEKPCYSAVEMLASSLPWNAEGHEKYKSLLKREKKGGHRNGR